jgi:mannose-6-phosphate isomerase
MYPLRFGPILRRYLWGGRRLAAWGKQLGPGDDYAESWEVADQRDVQSVVLAGPLAGRTLGELVRERGAALLGRHHPQPQFPLLLKLLDAQQCLSVQVHPRDEHAAHLDPPQRGKTEAWYVLDAPPGAVLYAGLKRGIDRQALRREVHRGTVALCLHEVHPRVGDCVFIPAGVVHAIGPGLLLAEIQQQSDITYRLYDWDRLGPDGRPRPLHVEQALEVIDFQHGPVNVQQPEPTGRAGVRRLVSCPQFVWDRWELEGRTALGGDGRCHVVLVVSGSMQVAGDAMPAPLTPGSTIVLPAAAGAVRVEPLEPVTLLDAYLP